MSHPVNFALYRREILVTKAAFFCVLTKMPYECQTWICMPVVMLLCCTINWSVTKRSRCVCSFIYGGCKFCIPTKKKNSTFIGSDAVLSAKSAALNQHLGKPVHVPFDSSGSITRHVSFCAEACTVKFKVHQNGRRRGEWCDAGNISSCVFDQLLGSVGRRRGRLWKGHVTSSYLDRKTLFMFERKWRQSGSTWQEGNSNSAHVGKEEPPAVTSELQEGATRPRGKFTPADWDRTARRIKNPKRENLTGVLILVLIVLIKLCFSYNNNKKLLV